MKELIQLIKELVFTLPLKYRVGMLMILFLICGIWIWKNKEEKTSQEVKNSNNKVKMKNSQIGGFHIGDEHGKEK